MMRSSVASVFRRFGPAGGSRLASTSSEAALTTSLDASTGVLTVALNRPQKLNSLDINLWTQIRDTFEPLCTATPLSSPFVSKLLRRPSSDPQYDPKAVRSVLLTGNGKHFCSGADVQLLASVLSPQANGACPAESREQLREIILELQRAFTVVAECRVPVVAAVQGLCLGAGVDLVTACDIRLASRNAEFSIKETDVAIVADVGTLQRLPKLGVPDGVVREWAFTGRHVAAEEAHRYGLVNEVFESQEELVSHASGLAGDIAKKSPVTIRGIKRVLNYGKDHSNTVDGLDYVATWNSAMLQSKDLHRVMTSFASKKK